MNIAAPGPSLLHIATSASELRARGLDLRVGRRLSGVVLATSGDRAVVDLAGTVVVARTELPLREGQAFTVSVSESRSDLVVLRVVADAGTEPVPSPEVGGEPSAQATARSLAAATARTSRRAVQAALLAAGVTPTSESLEAAAALLAQGLPLTPGNIDLIARRVDRFAGPRSEVARALAVARALDLPPTDTLIALLRQGLPGASGGTLASRLADIEHLISPMIGEQPQLPEPRVSPQQAVEAVLSTLSSVSESLPPELLASIGRLTRALALPPDMVLQAIIMAHEVDTAIRAMPASSPDAWPEVTSALLGVTDELEPAVEKAVAATASPVVRSMPPGAPGSLSGEGLREVARAVLAHLGNLALLVESSDATPQAVENALTALRNALEPHLPAQGPPTTLASELALRLESLLARVDSTLSLEPPQSADQVRDLLAAALARLSENIPGQPPDRLQVLAAVVERSRELLGPVTGWEPPPVRALARELADLAAMFAERAAGAQVREAVAEGIERLTDVLALAQAASSLRRSDLLALFVGRAAADVASMLARHVQSLLEWSAGSGAAEGWAPTPSSSPLSELAVRDALRDLLLTIAERVRPRLEGVLELLGSPWREPPVGLVQQPTGRVVDALLELIVRGSLADSEPSALSPAVREALAGARQAVVAASAEAVRADLRGLAELLARMVARPLVGGSDVAEAVRLSADLTTSTEAKLIGPDPGARLSTDLRAALARAADSADRSEAVVRALGPAPGQADIQARFAEVANAARAVGSAIEAQQLVHLAGVRLSTPVVAYIQVPVVVGQERRLAELKVLRDPRKRGVALDPSNMTVALRLDTTTLGLVVIVMRSRDGVLDLSFTLERPEYQRAVARELPDLRHSLDEAGFSVGAIAAEVRREASAAFEQLGAPAPEGASISILA